MSMEAREARRVGYPICLNSTAARRRFPAVDSPLALIPFAPHSCAPHSCAPHSCAPHSREAI